MASPGRPTAPPKPWERPGASGGISGPSPFAPPSNTTSTAAAVASSGAATGDGKDENGRNLSVSGTDVSGRPMPPRPWEQRGTTGTGYGTMSNYNRPGYGSYGSNSLGYSGGMYGGGSYGSSYMGGGYGSSYGSGMYGGGMGYGGGMYNRYGGAYGGGMGGYGMGGYGMYGPGDPNNPHGEPPPGPPNFWQSMLQTLSGVMNFFGRLSMLVDENTQAFHFFITALLQLCDRAGHLYGELARFVLRVLGFRSRARPRTNTAKRGLQGGDNVSGKEMISKQSAGEPAWDNVWSDGNN